MSLGITAFVGHARCARAVCRCHTNRSHTLRSEVHFEQTAVLVAVHYTAANINNDMYSERPQVRLCCLNAPLDAALPRRPLHTRIELPSMPPKWAPPVDFQTAPGSN